MIMPIPNVICFLMSSEQLRLKLYDFSNWELDYLYTNLAGPWDNFSDYSNSQHKSILMPECCISL